MFRAYYLLLGWSHSNIYWDLTTFASYVYLFRNSLLWTVPIHTDALWTLQCCLLRLAVLLYLKVTLYLFWFLGTFYCSVISIAFLLPVFLCWIDPPLFTTIFQVSRPQLRLWVPSTGSSLGLILPPVLFYLPGMDRTSSQRKHYRQHDCWKLPWA